MSETSNKKEEKITKNCLRCGGNLEFSPKHQAIFCCQCGTIYDIEKNKNITKHNLQDVKDIKLEDKLFADNNNVFNCPNCGSKLVLNKLEYTKKCPYCGSVQIKKTRINPGISPDSIIPFKFDEEVAAEKFKQAMKKKVFAPNAFKKKPISDNIYGIFIPTFAYDADSQTSYSGTEKIEHVHIDSNNIRRVSYSYRNFSGKFNMNHRNVLVEDSPSLNQLDLESIKPYNYNEMYKYNDDFIRGYTVEYHEHPIATCTDIAHTIMKNDINSSIRRKEGGNIVSLRTNTNFECEKFTYYLLPAYKVEYKYKEKKYNSYVNGQTGKVGGNAPKSKIKVTFFTIFMVLLLGGLTALFYYLSLML